MMKTSRAQREALKRVYDRDLADALSNIIYYSELIRRNAAAIGYSKEDKESDLCELDKAVIAYRTARYRTYLAFRRTVRCLPCDDCLIVPVGSIMMGIEIDGYTHT